VVERHGEHGYLGMERASRAQGQHRQEDPVLRALRGGVMGETKPAALAQNI